MHLMSASLFLRPPLYSFFQRLHAEKRQIIRKCVWLLLSIPTAVLSMVVTDYSFKIENFMVNKYNVGCFVFLPNGIGCELGLHIFFLPSKEGKPTKPTTAVQAGWTARWSTMALRHTELHACLETRSIWPGQCKKQTEYEPKSQSLKLLSPVS